VGVGKFTIGASLSWQALRPPSGPHRAAVGEGIVLARTAASGDTVAQAPCETCGQPLGGAAKRAVDLVLALTLIVLAAPVMALVAALIWLGMGGPVIFGHKRVGFQGRNFACYKFRTMACNAGELLERHLAANPDAAREWAATHKLANDPRVTRLGHVLRKSSLDELPQLFNVLRGDMSLIGPRPIVAEEVARYGRHIHAYLAARPGITGMWQTSGRSSVSYLARVARDRYYARRWSLWLDLVLLVKTIPAVLKFDQTA
jgi:exopolysaccharide production protein ExoY